jgi:DegV family protein with EDD domain
MMSKQRIRFVTDSTCDLPVEVIEKYQIGVVPCYINHSGGSFADDGKELVRDDYYAALPNLHPHPTTSAMPPGVAEQIIKQTLEGADHVVIASVSSKLSGVYNALRLGAAGLQPHQYTLVDSLNTTLGLGFQVWIGAEVAEQTGDVAQVIDAMARVRQYAHVYVALDTLEYLRRSGRVSWAAAGIGSLLQIKPILDVFDGEAHNAGRVRTFKRAVDEIIRLAQVQSPLDRMAVLYATDRSLALEVHDRVRDFAPPGEIPIVQITPSIGTHIGPNGVAVVTVSQKWKT